jgi:hypothetical protein
MLRIGWNVRQVLLAVAMAVAMLWGMVPVASAGDEWCPNDPLVVIHTPGGHTVPVHVTNYGLGVEHQEAVNSASIQTHVESTRGGQATNVTIVVQIPNDGTPGGFRTRSVASTQPMGSGTVYDTASGRSGRVMVLGFVLNVS